MGRFGFPQLYLLICFGLFSFFLSSPVFAQTVDQTLSFQQGNGNAYSTTVDTYLDSTAPDTARNSTADLFVSNGNGAPTKNILVSFPNIFGNNIGQIPPGSTIISASLQLTVWNNGDPVSVYQLLEPWDEVTATWNSQGAGLGVWSNFGAGAPVSHSTTLESTTTIGSGTRTFDITKAVQNWSNNPAINFGVTLQHTTNLTGDGVHFRSREYSNVAERPKLIVTFTPLLAPTSTPTPFLTPTPTIPYTGPTLSISGNQFYLGSMPIAPFGVRVFKAINDGPGGPADNSPTTNLIASLDAYKAHGVNSISISFEPGISGGGAITDLAFNMDGTLNSHYTDRIAQILNAARERNMVVFMTYFAQAMDNQINGINQGYTDVQSNAYLQTAVTNATNFLKPWRNVALYTVNEMGHGGFTNHPIFAQSTAANVNTILGWVKAADPDRVTQVGQGSTLVGSTLGTAECGNSDFCAGTGSTATPEINRPYVVIEYIRQDAYDNPGIFNQAQENQALTDAQLTKTNGAYWFWHAAWHQDFPPHFELGGDGIITAGVHWLYDGLANLQFLAFPDGVPTPTPTSMPTPIPTVVITPTPTSIPSAQTVDQTLSFQQGNGNAYSTTVDTYLDSTAPDTARNSTADLFVSNGNGAPTKNILVSFPNIFGNNIGQIPPGSTIISASLQLTVWNNGDPVSVYQLLEPWDEVTATWNSRGTGLGGWTNLGAGTPLSRSTTLESTTPIGSGVRTLNVTNAVRTWSSNPSTNFGLALQQTTTLTGDGVHFRSREYSNLPDRPKLTVTFN